MELGHVVTSRVFVDRTGIAVAGTTYFFLEEARKKTGKLRLLWKLLLVRWLPGLVRGSVPRPDPDSPAVVLFTSGSEKAPKAVPLTHRNLILNQRAGTRTLKVSRRDAILGFLPAFHSFGLSITGLYPLMAGLRVVRHPDPTDAAALARKIGLYKTTVLVGTPTFASYILERAQPGELTSLKLVVVGAEKCPQTVFDRFAQASPGTEVVEGYGITECSPVVSVRSSLSTHRGQPGTARSARRCPASRCPSSIWRAIRPSRPGKWVCFWYPGRRSSRAISARMCLAPSGNAKASAGT
jgi:long-chain-fatty-acid--[acyl-carrier-protein] ligase